MAKFFYKMQSILNIKYKLEEQAKTLYAQAAMKLDLEEQKLSSIKERKEEYEEKLRRMMNEVLNIIEIRATKQAVEILEEKIELQKIAVVRAKEQLELMREKLNEAIVERKTHEKLRENAFEQFMKEQDMLERKEVDEFVSFKYNKTTGSEEENSWQRKTKTTS